MKVNLRNLKFTGELAYYQDKATQGYVIRVMGSHNGTKWEVLGEEKGTGLPGEATKQQVSSDPNKFQDVVRLPQAECFHSFEETGQLRARTHRIYYAGCCVVAHQTH